MNDRLAAVMTLARECSPFWVDTLGDQKPSWVKTLAVVRSHSGRGLGESVMRACEMEAHGHGAVEVLLDCVDVGFLPDYCSRPGYDTLGRKDIAYPAGYTFPVVLMRKSWEVADPR